MNLSDVFNDFLTKQNAIVKQYADALQSIKNDQQFVLNQMVQNARGLSTIDQGLLPAKADVAGQLTNFIGTWDYTLGQLPLTILRLNLRGARKLRVQGWFGYFGSAPANVAVSIYCYLANELGTIPQSIDFFKLTDARLNYFSDTVGDQDINVIDLSGETDCAGAKFAYLIFPTFESNGNSADGFSSVGAYNALSSFQLLG